MVQNQVGLGQVGPQDQNLGPVGRIPLTALVLTFRLKNSGLNSSGLKSKG